MPVRTKRIISKRTATTSATFSYVLTGATTGTGLGTGTLASFSRGRTHVVVTATNSCGSTSCGFNLNVLDSIAPIITSTPDITVNSEQGTCGAKVNYARPTFIDNCPLCGGPDLVGHLITVNIAEEDSFLAAIVPDPTRLDRRHRPRH